MVQKKELFSHCHSKTTIIMLIDIDWAIDLPCVCVYVEIKYRLKLTQYLVHKLQVLEQLEQHFCILMLWNATPFSVILFFTWFDSVHESNGSICSQWMSDLKCTICVTKAYSSNSSSNSSEIWYEMWKRNETYLNKMKWNANRLDKV